MEITRTEIFIDAACRGNPGPSSFGLIAVTEDITFEDHGVLGEMTNQEAEFNALKKALETCVKHNWHNVGIYTDSRLVSSVSTGKWKLHSAKLIKIVEELARIAYAVKNVPGGKLEVTWLSREDPRIVKVDKLANEALNPRII